MQAETTGIEGHVRDGIEMYCNGNVLKYLKAIIMRSSNNRDQLEYQLAISFHQTTLPILRLDCISLRCWPRESHGNSKQPRMLPRQLIDLDKLTA